MDLLFDWWAYGKVPAELTPSHPHEEPMLDPTRGDSRLPGLTAGYPTNASGYGEATAMRPVRGPGISMIDAGMLPPSLGNPFVTATCAGYDAAAWLLAGGEVVLKVGCQARLLTDWEQNAGKYVGDFSHSPSRDLAQSFRHHSQRLLLAFCAFVEEAARNARLAEGWVPPSRGIDGAGPRVDPPDRRDFTTAPTWERPSNDAQPSSDSRAVDP